MGNSVAICELISGIIRDYEMRGINKDKGQLKRKNLTRGFCVCQRATVRTI